MRILSGVIIIGLATFGCAGVGNVEGSSLKPQKGQWDLGITDLIGVVTPASFVDVRENDTAGTYLRLRTLGVTTVQVPTLDVAYWITDRSAVSATLRYFYAHGTATLNDTAAVNGAIIAPDQSLTTDPVWVSAALFYGYRLTSAPTVLDVRLFAGLEDTFIDFRINGGQANVIPSSPGSETKEDFYRQALPLPTLKLETLYRLNVQWTLDGTLQGTWVNHWNSQRQEVATI